HRRLFGFVEDDRRVLIAAVEVEVEEPLPPAGRGWGGGETPAAQSLHPHPPAPSPQGGGGAILAEHLTTLDGPGLIVRGDTQIAVAEGWRATKEADGLIRL